MVLGHQDELQKAEKYPIRWVVVDRFHCTDIGILVTDDFLTVIST